MTGIIVNDKERPYEVRADVGGVDHDTCPNPNCGKVGIEPTDRIGVSGDGMAGSPDGMIYYCDPRDGGSGDSWTRSSKDIIEQRTRKGLATKNPTGTATRGTYVSTPSEAFRANYERAFGHD